MLRKTGLADRSIVTGILSRSFKDNLSVNFIAGNSQRRISALMKYAFDYCSLFGEVYLTEDSSGCALVIYPEKKKTTFLSIVFDLKLVFSCVGIFGIGKVLRRESQIKKLQDNGRCSYLWFVGVDPNEQHKGIGSTILEELVSLASADGRDVILETSTLRNIPWYKSFGFQTYATLDLGYKLFFMKRYAGV